jgi:hypothetical protein
MEFHVGFTKPDDPTLAEVIPFGGNGDLFSAQASPPKTLGVVGGLLNNHQK